MFSLITDLPDAAGVSSQEIYLEAADLESLLVSWLRELLLMFEMESKLPVRYEIEEIVPTSLRAQVYQVDFDPAKQVLNRHIKAVTYHGLEVTPTGQGWEATIVFDT
jgi:SHS2 domain-containing protein